MIQVDVVAGGLDIETSDPLRSVFRFKTSADVQLPQQGQFFVLHEVSSDTFHLMQRLPMNIPDDDRLSCVKPEVANIREAVEFLNA